jgi:hypothetical protein
MRTDQGLYDELKDTSMEDRVCDHLRSHPDLIGGLVDELSNQQLYTLLGHDYKAMRLLCATAYLLGAEG